MPNGKLQLQFVDPSRSEWVHKGLDRLCELLAADDIAAGWCSRIEDAKPGSTLILHDPVHENGIPKDARAFGQRTLNRRERLVLADRLGLPVPRWCSISERDELADVFDRLEAPHFLYKADWSYSRGGVRLVSAERTVGLDRFDPDGDVFMHVLDGCPHTHKVDVFYSRVIGCRRLHTRSVLDPSFPKSFSDPSELGEIPAMADDLSRLGRDVMAYGVGLLNVDVMVDSAGREWVVELNTCSVGREATWMRWPDTYLPGYAEGIVRWAEDGCPGQPVNGARLDVPHLSARSGGLSVYQST
ncbi:MAG: hypothetical protein AAF441_22635 [Pseudomonadota bacterium]